MGIQTLLGLPGYLHLLLGVAAQKISDLLVVDLQQRHLHRELGVVLRELLKDLVQGPGDDTC